MHAHTHAHTLTINLVNINNLSKKGEHSRSSSGSSHPLCVKTLLHSYTQIAKSTNNPSMPKIQAEDAGFLTFNAMELCKIYPLDRAGGGGGCVGRHQIVGTKAHISICLLGRMPRWCLGIGSASWSVT